MGLGGTETSVNRQEFGKDWPLLFFKCIIEFTEGDIKSWAFLCFEAFEY